MLSTLVIVVRAGGQANPYGWGKDFPWRAQMSLPWFQGRILGHLRLGNQRMSPPSQAKEDIWQGLQTLWIPGRTSFWGLSCPCPVEASQKLLGSPQWCLGLRAARATNSPAPHPQPREWGVCGPQETSEGDSWSSVTDIPVPRADFSPVSLAGVQPQQQRVLPNPSPYPQDGSGEVLWNNGGDFRGALPPARGPEGADAKTIELQAGWVISFHSPGRLPAYNCNKTFYGEETKWEQLEFCIISRIRSIQNINQEQ